MFRAYLDLSIWNLIDQKYDTDLAHLKPDQALDPNHRVGMEWCRIGVKVHHSKLPGMQSPAGGWEASQAASPVAGREASQDAMLGGSFPGRDTRSRADSPQPSGGYTPKFSPWVPLAVAAAPHKHHLQVMHLHLDISAGVLDVPPSVQRRPGHSERYPGRPRRCPGHFRKRPVCPGVSRTCCSVMSRWPSMHHCSFGGKSPLMGASPEAAWKPHEQQRKRAVNVGHMV